MVLHHTLFCGFPVFFRRSRWCEWISGIDGPVWNSSARNEAHGIGAEPIRLHDFFHTVLQRAFFQKKPVYHSRSGFHPTGILGRNDFAGGQSVQADLGSITAVSHYALLLV